MIKHCVILAAGKNSRLDNGIPKSLITVGEKSLLERHVELFSKAGVTEFAVVVGYRGHMVRDAIERFGKLYPVNVNVIENPSYELENGYSLYAAREWVRSCGAGHFFFTMADHFFSGHFLEKAAQLAGGASGCQLRLAVDKPGAHNGHIDLEDVTRVQVENDLIVGIGKGITEYNYFDTGLFCAQPAIFVPLHESIQEGKSSISNMVSKLMAVRQAGILDLSSCFWSDIDTPADLKNTLELLQTLQQPGQGH